MSSELYYKYSEPTAQDGVTFVFFNALTGETGMWLTDIAPALHEAGHGTLVFNYRGQPNSPFDASTPQNAAGLVEDCRATLEHVAPKRAVLVGLSIGGLFAAQAHLAGAQAVGLVFINTLRKDGPRLRWINDAVVRAVEVGGPELMRDLWSPLIMNEDWQAENRANCLGDSAYTPIDRDSGTYHLLRHVGTSADWHVNYEELKLKTLVITGEQDRIFRNPRHVDELFARLPDATRIDMQNAGHMVPVEQTQTFIAALKDFAKTV